MDCKIKDFESVHGCLSICLPIHFTLYVSQIHIIGAGKVLVCCQEALCQIKELLWWCWWWTQQRQWKFTLYYLHRWWTQEGGWRSLSAHHAWGPLGIYSTMNDESYFGQFTAPGRNSMWEYVFIIQFSCCYLKFFSHI